ncbi:MAG: adaptor protein MecA [Lachnospiraceae bacterium]|nr:adaptor protein MecA [Lachnospiraceae bacterium]
MKIEKINDKQIRCTLTGDDLADRQLKLSELAYGTEKAKALFRDMMEQAKKDFGFDPANSPIMVEAIPMAPDSVMLIISKVDDPEELDTRFSRFSEARSEETPSAPEKHFAGADDILDLFKKICDSKLEEAPSSSREQDAAQEKKPAEEATAQEPSVPVNLLQLFHFSTLDGAIEAAHGLNNCYQEQNSLYKDNLTGDYLLVLYQNSCSPEDFNRVCNMLSEFSQTCRFHEAGAAFLNEHMECIIKDTALQTLIQL